MRPRTLRHIDERPEIGTMLRGRVVLYADERTEIGRRAADYLNSRSIPYTHIPVSGIIPEALYGVAKYSFFSHSYSEFELLIQKYLEDNA